MEPRLEHSPDGDRVMPGFARETPLVAGAARDFGFKGRFLFLGADGRAAEGSAHCR